MKAWVLAGLTSLILGGCQKKFDEPWSGIFESRAERGHYVAVGIYSPGELWRHLKPLGAPESPESDAGASTASSTVAGLNDDDRILVVMDSTTGEVRQCGNLSGHCIGFNPWTRPLDASQNAPVPLLKNAQRLQFERDAAAENEQQQFELRRLKP